MPIGAGTPEVAGAYLELGAALLILAVGARIASRFDLSPIAFYLLGGLALGASGRPELTAEFVELTANLGVVLLLFLLGLEYGPEELRTNLRAHGPAGAVDALLNFTPGFAAALVLGWEPQAALVLGGITWISSSGIIAKALSDLGRIGNRETPAILSVLVTEDLAMVVYLPVTGSVLLGGTVFAAIGSVAVAAAAAAVTLVVSLRYGAQIARLVDHDSQEVVLLSALGLVLLVAGLAEELQVSAAVGAFLLGVAFSGEVAHRTRELLTPLRDLAAALFFLFFGLSIDASNLPGVAIPAVLLAVLTALTKIVTGWWAALRGGIEPLGRARAAAALVARGEFSIVIAGLGVASGLDEKLGSLAAAYVLILALAGPVLMKYYMALMPVVDALDRLAIRGPVLVTPAPGRARRPARPTDAR